MSVALTRSVVAGVPVLIAQAAIDPATSPLVLWYPGYRASAAANEAELRRLADAGFVAVGVDAVGHGERAAGDPDERIADHPRGALGVMLELAGATVREIPALLDALAARRLGDPARVAVVGVSMGGYVAYRAPLVAPALRAVVALLGSPEWPEEPGSAHLHLGAFRDVSVLSITAERDESVPPMAARRFHERLAAVHPEPGRLGHIELAGAGHLMSADQWERAITATVHWLRVQLAATRGTPSHAARVAGDASAVGEVTIRAATMDDLPALAALIEESVRALSVGYLTPGQIEAELRYVVGPDTQLIRDGTYYVAVAPDGGLAGAGGWSRRRALYGGDQFKAAAPHAVASGDAPDALLDPARDPARIRAMFVHPAWARRGIGRRLFEVARAAATEAGFRALVLTATLPGVPLYERLGFRADRRYVDSLPDGTEVPVVEMSREIDDVGGASRSSASRSSGAS